MEHQDFQTITIGNKSLKNVKKEIKPKNSGPDLHAIKLENETENFSIQKIPKELSQEITNARTAKKFSQKDIANKLNIQSNVYSEIENGKALYDGKTKELINKIQKQLGVRFQNFGKKK
jgi:ribosome-binding protein aMBF1 (putative translation factor)